MIAAEVGGSADPYFLQAFFRSDTGQALLTAAQQVTAAPTLSTEELAETEVPVPSSEIQRAIGNKVRKAERLLELARDAEVSFTNWMAAASKSERMTGPGIKMLSHSPAATIADSYWVREFDPGDRVDPWPYHIAPRTVQAHLLKIAKAPRFGQFFSIRPGQSKRRASLDSNDHHISILHVDSDGHIDWAAARTERVEGEGVELHPGDVLYSLLNPKETRVGYIPPEFGGDAVASTEFAILEPADDYQDCPYLLCAILRSDWIRVQATFLTRSSSLSRRRLLESDLMRILIPWNGDAAVEVNRRLERAVGARNESSALVAEAKAATEALIDGTVDHARLLADGVETDEWLSRNPSPFHDGAINDATN
jgi:hypothetical protein